ncbi:transcriptional regulator [Niastella yeongjuensis]|uniref:Transcriptional regulator n=1 Tax=Niastella yeongjuensis TaxID=354355 RepID=A0A1V9F3A0_9BACT|nr:helix-turn-helix transcriptional regulator [Niastella yeongjuensis]OQP52752.1 transcriptional regulator [Niastella yeongjuensis]SEP18920.1 Cro/C1-type HTH DNA-binding domain-containing protein [Niastella yeongjuensis]
MAERKINRLKVTLAEKDKTNRWLADQIGYTEGMVSRWVSNTKQPPLEVLYDISLLLKVDIRDLIESNASVLKK